MDFIGDWRCKNNALDSNLRCAINPYGPCEGCADFEQVRERLMSLGKPIAPPSQREIRLHKAKMKLWQLWSIVKYPIGMLQVICGLTVLGLLVSNKYPISKDHFSILFQQDCRIVGNFYILYRFYDVITEFHFKSIHRTNFDKFIRLLEPSAWLLILSTTANLLFQG
jgi:ABC-type tungstate transport system substrate-binding protein